jgi:hypothetical protein
MLRITNGTGIPLAFELVAQDVVVQEGTRVFLPAGETEHSAAATAVFSRREIVVPPGETASVDVTITVPPSTAVRAIAAIFRGKTVVSRPGAVAMTASLGSLITFTLSSEFKIEASPLEIGGQSNSANVSVSRWLKNTGSEPVIPSGAVAVMTRSGALVGKTPIEPQRLLPGERLRFVADCPAQLRSGSYRAVVSLQYEGRVITDTADFTIL